MLDGQGKRLLGLLVERLPMALPSDPRTFVTYKEVHQLLKLNQLGKTYGESLKIQGLTSLADWTSETNVPAITGLIVSEGSLLPGEGYFKLFEKEEDFQWWREQIRKSKDFDWSPFIDPDAGEEFAAVEVSDIEEPPDRLEVRVYRIIRDTKIAQSVKRWHNFECQVCGETIELPDGKRYAEAHHIKPLGGKHLGPDVEGNVLCLCPNHHAQVDLGVIPIDLETLRLVPHHKVRHNFVNYHNECIYLGPNLNADR